VVTGDGGQEMNTRTPAVEKKVVALVKDEVA
jgi:hypothetical protein